MIEDLQKELKEGGNEEAEEITGIKFIDDLYNEKKNQSRNEAAKILSKIQDKDGFE